MTDVNKSPRLFFIDAIRSWAILMILQGHFIGALLSNNQYNNSILFIIWNYFRGVTAPVFFTVSGFIFTFLLLKNPNKGWKNPRVLKGLKRSGQLIAIGYLLQLKFFRLINHGTFNSTFNIVHVLQCIGLSIIVLSFLYLLFHNSKKHLFPIILCLITILLFLFESEYAQWDYSFMPELLSNYFTIGNGSVFTIVPWFGFASFGAFLSVIFANNYLKPKFYFYTLISMLLGGIFFILLSFKTPVLMTFLFGEQNIPDGNNYLFLRLGDVLLVFTFFMLFRSYFKNPLFLKIGQHTLSIYIVHSVILYGSFTGLGLNRFFYHSLTATQTIIGVISFIIAISLLVLGIEKGKEKYPF